MKKEIPVKTITAGAIGGAIEFYDFTLYGVLAPIFAMHYFPAEEKHWAIISAYMVFAVGFIARPIGSLIFGHIGDLYGRKKALCGSLFFMSAATLMIGILPTYQSIGFWAPVGMIASRIIQGISAGGEYSGAMILSIEHSDKKRIGLTGGLVASGCMAGLALGSIAGTICLLPGMPEWCWRVPFLLGFLVSIVAIYVRLHIKESIDLTKIVRNVNYKKRMKDIIPVVFMSGFNGIGIYIYLVFFSTFITKSSGVSPLHAKITTSVGIILLMSMQILFGWLSDKVGRIKLMKIGNILTVFMAIVLFLSPYSKSNYTYSVIMQFTFIISLGMYSGPLNVFVVEVFDKSVRYRCTSISYSIGIGIIGGSAPLIASLISLGENEAILLSSYISLSGVIAFLSLLFISKRIKNKTEIIQLKVSKNSTTNNEISHSIKKTGTYKDI